MQVQVHKWAFQNNLTLSIKKNGYESGSYSSTLEELVPAWWEDKHGKRDDFKGELPVFWIDIALEKSDYMTGVLYLQAVSNSGLPLSAKSQNLKISGNADVAEIRCDNSTSSVRGQAEFSCLYKVVNQAGGKSLSLNLENAGKQYKSTLNIKLTKGNRIISTSVTEGNSAFIDYHTLGDSITNQYLCKNKKNICLRVKLKDVLGEYEFTDEEIAKKKISCKSQNIDPCIIKEAKFNGGRTAGGSVSHSSEVQFIANDVPKLMKDFWKENVKNFEADLHYKCDPEKDFDIDEKPKKDPNCDKKYRADVSNKNKKWDNWFGPARPFKVSKFTFGGIYHGTRSEVSVLNVSQTSEVCKIAFVHLDMVNVELLAGIGRKVHAGGSYLGKTSKRIAVSSGAHLHIEIVSNSQGVNDRAGMRKCLQPQ